MTTKTKHKEGHDLRIIGFGPADLECRVEPGFNLVLGRNGSGKTRNLIGLGWSLGMDVQPVMRHGQEKAYVEIDGERIRTLDKPLRNIGDVELALNSASPIADIICPDIIDPKRGEERRIQALLSLVDVKVGQETIGVLVTNGDGEPDDGALDYLSETEPDLEKASIVTAADRIRRRIHELKRTWEKKAQNSQGQVDALKVPKPETVSSKGVDEAQRDYDAAVGDLREAKGSAEQRGQREAERASISEHLGGRPDVAAAETSFAQADKTHYELYEREAELKQQLAAIQAEIRASAVTVTSAQVALEDAKRQAERWDRNKETLDTPITGATQADVEAASKRVEESRAELESARATDAWKQASLKVREAQELRDGATQRANHYERLAKGVTGRLAHLLSQAGLESLTVEDSKLMYVHPGGKLEPFVELSWGERTKAVISLLARRAVPYGILVLPRQFYDGLDDAAREEVGGVFKAAGYAVVLEEPSGDETLRVEAV